MSRVTSPDGTPIAYDRQGSGPPVLLVGGGLVDRSENTPLASALATRCTAYNYDRRGRGHSGDSPAYAVAREIEDIEALAAAAGGPVHLVGVSSGGALALAAAAAGVPVDRIAVYEVPYLVGPELGAAWAAYRRDLADALADGRPGDAVAHFMRLAGSPETEIDAARRSPGWAEAETLAPTLAYDAACLGTGAPPADLLARITRPTLVLTGGAGGFFEDAAAAIVDAVPHARRETLDGQGHVADPDALAAALTRFFTTA